MSTILKFLFAGVVAYAGYWLFTQAGLEQAKETPSNSAMVGYWGGLILVAVVGAAFFAFTVLPTVGDIIAGFFYSAPNTEVEKGPHHAALAKVAAGDYPAAVAEYEKALEKDPEDVMALIEIARLQVDKLGDPQAAVERLEQALEGDWDKEKVGPVSFRLADLYWRELDDPERARAVLEQIVGLLPGTTHAANASQRIRQIEETERQRQEQEFLARSSGPAVEEESAVEEAETPAADEPSDEGTDEVAAEDEPGRPTA